MNPNSNQPYLYDIGDQPMSTADSKLLSPAGIRPALGRRVIDFEGFDTFEAPTYCRMVTLTSEELTSFCPVTDQPDFYHLEVVYQPRRLCLETKTFKLYIQTFRDTGQFAEELASRICSDLYDALQPNSINVSLTQQVRGGVQLKASAYRVRDVEETGKES